MYLTIYLYLTVLVLSFTIGDSKVCNDNYYKKALVAVGKKPNFNYYPWRNYENTEKEVKFLSIRGDKVKHICKYQLPAGVDEVLLFNVQLEYIEPGFFENSMVLQVIIQGNHLNTITHGVFNGTNIKSLALSDNQIKRIEARAFEDMPLLEAVALDDNRIKVWDPSWFANAQILNEISASNNLLEELPQDTTKYMVNAYEEYSTYVLYGNVNFDNNRIKYVHPLAFGNLEYFGSVSLSNNKLLLLPEGVFKGFKFLHSLYLNTNDFICFSNNTIKSFRGVKRLYLGRNRLNRECVDMIQEYFSVKNDMVFF